MALCILNYTCDYLNCFNNCPIRRWTENNLLLIFFLFITCFDSSTINGLKLVGTCNTGDISDRLKVRWDLPLFLLRDCLGFVNLNHSVIHASRKEFDRLIDRLICVTLGSTARFFRVSSLSGGCVWLFLFVSVWFSTTMTSKLQLTGRS